MKHGIKLRKLGRTSSHRTALLRNLVSALLHHEQIKTTVPKAKEAARLAESMITLGKRGTIPALRSAQGFLFPGHYFAPPSRPIPNPPPPSGLFPTSTSPTASSSSTTSPRSRNELEVVFPVDESAEPSSPSSTEPLESELAESFKPPTSLLPKLFSTLTDRYRSRPGGYTRISKYGNRAGDHAPYCVLSLVDGPRDFQWEMVGRILGKEVFEMGYDVKKSKVVIKELVKAAKEGLLRRARATEVEGSEGLAGLTKTKLEKVVRFRSEVELEDLERIACDHADTLRVKEPTLTRLLNRSGDRPKNRPLGNHKGATSPIRAGMRFPGSATASAGLRLAQQELGRVQRDEIWSAVDAGRRKAVEIAAA